VSLHFLCEARDRRALADGVRRFEIRMARAVNRCLGRRRGKVFADRYHARVLRSPRQVRNALVYVIQNLRHHDRERRTCGRGFDPCSSAASFTGWSDGLPRHARWMQEALAEPPATAPAASWLLGVDWRRLGLVRLDEAQAS
jgi:hypothetical protein